MIKAQQGQEELDAHGQLSGALTDAGMKGSDAALTKALLIGHFGTAEQAMKAVAAVKLGYGSPAEQTSGQQMSEGKIAGPVATPGNYQMPVGSPLANVPVQQSQQGAAQTSEMNALAGLNAHKDQDPAAFRAAQLGATTPDGIAALSQAVKEGRLDPTRINARSAPILAQIEQNNPGMNFNRLHADANLQANATFQQKAMSIDMLPGLLSHVTSLGKKLNGGTGYNDLKSVGMMQQWANGQTNDPDYTEYMTARNDTLLRLAGVMRGVGMSDQAHTAEVQAMSPTLAPYALDAWFKGQMSVVTPLLERQNRITHLGEPGGGTPAAAVPSAAVPAAPPTAAGAAPTTPAMSLDDYLKARGH
jgi:hypothetical protein